MGEPSIIVGVLHMKSETLLAITAVLFFALIAYSNQGIYEVTEIINTPKCIHPPPLIEAPKHPPVEVTEDEKKNGVHPKKPTTHLPKFRVTHEDRFETSQDIQIVVWTWKGGSSVNADQLRQTIAAVHERLSIIPREHSGYVDLLMETCAAETLLGEIVRQRNGPALGIFQMLRSTERDTLAWLKRRFPEVYVEVRSFYDRRRSAEWNLTKNVPYSAAVSTAYYWRRCGDALADLLETRGDRARVWKKYYNTYLGKGTVSGYIKKSERYL